MFPPKREYLFFFLQGKKQKNAKRVLDLFFIVNNYKTFPRRKKRAINCFKNNSKILYFPNTFNRVH